jgi:hypothetical protein
MSSAKLLHPILVKSIPKLPAKCGDLLYETRQERLKVQKVVEALESQEAKLKEYIIENLPKSKANGITGSIARVELDKKAIPSVKDWDAFYAYIAKHQAWELLQRRPAEAAVKERWEAGETVPGVEKFIAIVVSCTKK